MPYIIQTAVARVRGKAKNYPYNHVAVLEVAPGVQRASRIDSRAKDVLRIAWDSGACPARGSTMHSAWQQALAYAQQLCNELNYQEDMKEFLHCFQLPISSQPKEPRS